MHKKSILKPIQLALLIAGLCSSCAFSGQPAANMAKGALETQITVMDMAREMQAEAKLEEILAGRPLRFKAVISKIYGANDFALLWTEEEARRHFLHEYAAMAASGISADAIKSLRQIDEAESAQQPLLQDILLTDAFLDYSYYVKNLSLYAQRWLYSANKYKAKQPEESAVEQWLSALNNGKGTEYIQNLASQNPIYRQTIERVGEILHAQGGHPGELYKLALNAQRLRLIPDFNNGIFVNIPTYQLNYYRDGKLVLNSKVIVGKNKRRTPVMYSKLSNVVVNPPWNAPVRLINEDIIPKVKQDPGYLSRNGYSIIDRNGNTIDPYSIDWASVGSRFPYHLRQAAGDHSALGRYKFNMPSSDAIYLHDTPSRHLFKKKDRALSSGCVRVEKSDQLAGMLLQEAGWSTDKKQKVLNSRKTTSATVRSDNPVYLYYVTAWMENGKLHTAPDIYGYDAGQVPNYIDWNLIGKYL
ncbi:L,D-transpeptidase family protein [Mesocricetibacter intestinalis]|uniref:L,D-transpeptidase family protein n=1 Tax=Mesocricetibacter intestinalis TaxID=1521930 RepID=UPI00105BDEA4|nr:L,D-transpeptidase family protein [Mesocricetibacter intestinalis]